MTPFKSCALLACLLGSTVLAQTNLLKNSDFSRGLNFWHSNSYGVKYGKPAIVDGQLFVRSGHDLKSLSVFQQEMIPLKAGHIYRLTVQAYSSSADRPLEISLAHEDGGAPYFFRRIELSERSEAYAFAFEQPVSDPGAVLTLNYGSSKSDLNIRSIELAPLPGNAPYQLKVEQIGDGAVDMQPKRNVYEAGERVRLTARSDRGNAFLGWRSQGVFRKAKSIEIEMTDDIELVASFYKIEPPKPDNHRAIVLTDMGNEPDDAQTAVRLLMYANELDLEGIIAVTSFYQRWTVSPQLLRERIDAYRSVVANLQQHDSGWPHPDQLNQIAAPGQPGYGMENVGDGKSSEGSKLIKKAILSNDPRPLHFCINAGANTLAQALWELMDELPTDRLKAVLEKVRVYDDTGQDDAGAWIAKTFPDLFYLRSRYQVFAFGAHAIGEAIHFQGPKVWAADPLDANDWSFDQHLQSQHNWADQHVRYGHGELGSLYLERLWGFEGGGTSTWIGLINKGLYDPGHMTWGGWGGRFKDKLILNAQSALGIVNKDQKKFEPFYMYQEAADTWPEGKEIWGLREVEWKNSIDAPIWRWRKAYFNDFQARMDWCVEPRETANHNPVIVYRGNERRKIEELDVEAGKAIELDVSESYDPDGDALSFRWWLYPEPSSFDTPLAISDSASRNVGLRVPREATGDQYHLILEVWDDGEPNLASYKRFVLSVTH